MTLEKNMLLQLNGNWQFRDCSSNDWMDATVPGCNFTDLLANGAIEDPFWGANEARLQWLENRDWEYKKTFYLDAEDLLATEIELVAEGLDTFCDVYINEKLAVCARNMFIGHTVAVKSLLEVGENTLRVVFRSPIKEVRPLYEKNGYTYPAENDKSNDKLSVYCRKAAYHFGWDWGPRFVSSGIWRDIYLKAVNHANLRDIHFVQQSLSDDLAEYQFNVAVEVWAAFSGKLVISCDQLHGYEHVIPVLIDKPSEASIETLLSVSDSIANPELWWPNGLGEQNLYTFRFALMHDDEVISRGEKTIGFRTIEVVSKPDAMGESFFVKVNGHATFMKGANYIPDDSFLARVSSDQLKQTFESAIFANMNMLRVWGGGVYQSDEFYQLADEYGILIWQDFMFACSLYPAHDVFVENVRLEAEYNVKRLRHHACLALWCGNNEIEMGIKHWQWPEKFGYSDSLYEQLKQDYMKVFDECLPSVVKALQPEAFYLRSSPIGFWEDDEDHKGNHHYWGVWHGEEPFSEYQRRIPRFMSEFGFQSFPIYDSVKKFCPADQMDIESAVMTIHQKHPRGNGLIRRYFERDFQTPRDVESLFYLSQVQQALGLKMAFEAHRAAMPFCMGSLYWQFNDTWPAASWSGIDFYGRRKALHHQAQRSFAKQIIVFSEDDENLNCVFVSDTLEETEGHLMLQIVDFNGHVLWQSETPFDTPGNTAETICSLSKNQVIAHYDQNCSLLRAEAYSDNKGLLASALHYFVPNKALNLELANIKADVIEDNGEIVLNLSTDTLVRQLYVSVDDVMCNCTDNFFDLIPGEAKRLQIEPIAAQTIDLESVRSGLRFKSLVDTYQSEKQQEVAAYESHHG